MSERTPEAMFLMFLEDFYDPFAESERRYSCMKTWQIMLNDAGIEVSDNMNLFIRHTLLVVSARLLKLNLRNQTESDAVLNSIDEGFASWVCDTAAGQHRLLRMANRLRCFDWRNENRDILKDAYHALIPNIVRKEFGEYYTPDWLAIKVVEETLDDEWLDDSIVSDGLGVLDPACGSGTFLFHSARRILERIRTHHPELEHRSREIVVRLVKGIDVHPIAVEMARATLEMALPNTDESEPQVHLGDAMDGLEGLKSDRIIANPPWIVANDMQDGDRKDVIDRYRKEYSLNARLAGSSARGDLSSVFSARAADLYLASEGRMGLVLPGTALTGLTWKPWRSGNWGMLNMTFESAWKLDGVEPPVFANAPNGTCAVFMSRTPQAGKLVRSAIQNGNEVEFVPDSSPYLSEFKAGAQSLPHCLLFVPKENVYSAGASESICGIMTKKSTKLRWKGHYETATIEKRCLYEIATSRVLKPFRIESDMYVIVPIVAAEAGLLIANLKDKEFEEQLPLLFEYWKRADRFYQIRKVASSGDTLSGNLDYRKTLSKQMKFFLNLNTQASLSLSANQLEGRRKVFYNSSGGNNALLRAARERIELIAGETLYWHIADSEDEAAYLCGVINAPCLQLAWRSSKTAPLHFHKNPLRMVPVPKFNSGLHLDIAELAKQAEAGFTDVIAKELNATVSELLPNHAQK